jgi:hypothetical protein
VVPGAGLGGECYNTDWCRWCLVLGWAISALSILPIPLYAGTATYTYISQSMKRRHFRGSLSIIYIYQLLWFIHENTDKFTEMFEF